MKPRLVLLLAALAFVAQAFGLPFAEKHVAASLVAESDALVPGQTTTVALRLVHEEHWHTYWKNPGEAGLPTTISWKLPPGFAAGPIQWPAPAITDTGGVLTLGYGGDLLLLVDITAPANLPTGEPITLQARADWLMCKESCVPGNAKLSLTLPVAATAAPDAQWSARIAAARAAVPPTTDQLVAHAYRQGRELTIRVEPRGSTVLAAGPVAFFAGDAAVETQALQPAHQTGATLDFTVRQSESAGSPTELNGLLIAPEGWWPGGPKAVEIQIPVTDGPAPTLTPAANTTSPTSAVAPAQAPTNPVAAKTGLLGLLGLAFVGGAILNLMPCVFPVLGIKILGFVQQAGEDRAKVKLHGIAFSAGVLVSFWILAVLLLVLRPAAGGAEHGWGFQLQNPGFVFALAVVMLTFGLSLSGVFEIGGSLIGTGSALQAKSGLSGSFFSGVLATVVATPCSAPFLGVALAGALTLPAAQSLLVFSMIALGLSAPYLVLSIFPQFIRLLPRPGAWMETFKQFMAFPLYATSGFLLWVLAAQLRDDYFGFLFALLALTVIAFATWVFGRWAAPHRERRTRWTAMATAALLIAGGLFLGWPRTPADAATTAAAGSAAIPHPEWQPWSAEAVAQLRAEGRIIYVDFTARWCVTCQVNKGLVFSSTEVLKTFHERKVATLRADWTNQDPKITAELQRFNRAAVPMNLVYLPGRAEPVLLPEVLTPGLVLDAVNGKRP